MKAFYGYFVIFESEREGEEITVYPIGKAQYKLENSKDYYNEGPQLIAKNLLKLIENRVMPVKASQIQQIIANVIQNLNKIPVILFEDKEIRNQLLGYRSISYIKEF